MKILKRAIKYVIGAMLGAFAAFGMTSAAQAYTPQPPCTSYVSSPAVWPTNGHAFVCTTNTSLAHSILLQARNYPTAVVNRLNANNTDLFVFDTVAQYNAYPDFAADYTSDRSTGHGLTIRTQGTNHPAPAVAILLTGETNLTVLYRAMNHEIGHAFDISYEQNIGGLWYPLSAQANFNTYLGQDLQDFDANVVRQPNGTVVPISTNTWVNTWGLSLTCASTYTTNSDRELCMNNVVGDPEDVQNREIFANEFANQQGNGAPTNDAGNVLKNYFQKGKSTPEASQYRSYDYVRDLAAGTRLP